MIWHKGVFDGRPARPWRIISDKHIRSAWIWLLSVASALGMQQKACASENVPHRPFAQWADVPLSGQFVVGFVYEESEAYHMWAAGKYQNVSWPANGESYGIDINQGYLSAQYGITERIAADLSVGYTSIGWRYFSNGNIEQSCGLTDSAIGVRYQFFNEAEAKSPWLPTLTVRAGVILPGTYNENFPFAPGLHSVAFEPEVLARKHFGWTGLGAYGDGMFRVNTTTGDDQYLVAVGLFQQIKRWELEFGYRHLQTLSGSDIIYPVNPAANGGYDILYPRDPRENSDAIEAGFSYTTSKRHWRYGFHLLSVVDGNNTDSKLWVGGSIDVPIGGKKEE